MFQYQKEYLKEMLGIKEYLTIEEAYRKMEVGHKVAHTSYTEDEFNFIENGIIKDEGGCHWRDKMDIPWKERVESDWAQTEWFICDEREMRKKIRTPNVPFHDYYHMPANREAIVGKTPIIVHIDESVKKIKEKMTRMVEEKVKLEERPQKKMEVPIGYGLALDNVIEMTKGFNVNKNEYAGNKDGSQGFSAKRNRELNKRTI